MSWSSDYSCGWIWVRYFSMPVVVTLFYTCTKPGRWLLRNRNALPVSNRISWCLKELPSMLIPLYALMTLPEGSLLRPPLLPLTLFTLHYAQRSLLYPCRVSAGSVEPLQYVVAAALFTTWNGQMQTISALYCSGDHSAAYTWRHAVGLVAFAVGAAVNIDSDQRLLGLRRRGGSSEGPTRYSVPRGGLFEYVTAANYLGEVIEWWGYALVAGGTPAALFFAGFTTVYLTISARERHDKYRAIIPDYPPHRKCIIPGIY